MERIDPSPSPFPLPFPPNRLIPPLTRGVKSPASPEHPQELSCKATKMSRLCLSTALLVLLGTLVAGTPEGDDSNKDSKSQLLSPLQTGWREKGSPWKGLGSRGGASITNPHWISPGKLGNFHSRDIS